MHHQKRPSAIPAHSLQHKIQCDLNLPFAFILWVWIFYSTMLSPRLPVFSKNSGPVFKSSKGVAKAFFKSRLSGRFKENFGLQTQSQYRSFDIECPVFVQGVFTVPYKRHSVICVSLLYWWSVIINLLMFKVLILSVYPENRLSRGIAKMREKHAPIFISLKGHWLILSVYAKRLCDNNSQYFAWWIVGFTFWNEFKPCFFLREKNLV